MYDAICIIYVFKLFYIFIFVTQERTSWKDENAVNKVNNNVLKRFNNRDQANSM